MRPVARYVEALRRRRRQTAHRMLSWLFKPNAEKRRTQAAVLLQSHVRRRQAQRGTRTLRHTAGRVELVAVPRVSASPTKRPSGKDISIASFRKYQVVEAAQRVGQQMREQRQSNREAREAARSRFAARGSEIIKARREEQAQATRQVQAVRGRDSARDARQKESPGRAGSPARQERERARSQSARGARRWRVGMRTGHVEQLRGSGLMEYFSAGFER